MYNRSRDLITCVTYIYDTWYVVRGTTLLNKRSNFHSPFNLLTYRDAKARCKIKLYDLKEKREHREEMKKRASNAWSVAVGICIHGHIGTHGHIYMYMYRRMYTCIH